MKDIFIKGVSQTNVENEQVQRKIAAFEGAQLRPKFCTTEWKVQWTGRHFVQAHRNTSMTERWGCLFHLETFLFIFITVKHIYHCILNKWENG